MPRPHLSRGDELGLSQVKVRHLLGGESSTSMAWAVLHSTHAAAALRVLRDREPHVPVCPSALRSVWDSSGGHGTVRRFGQVESAAQFCDQCFPVNRIGQDNFK